MEGNETHFNSTDNRLLGDSTKGGSTKRVLDEGKRACPLGYI